MTAPPLKPLFTRLAACLASITLIAGAHAQGGAPLRPSAGKPLPALSFTDESGKILGLAAARHKLTAVHFWATWCVPCVEELPAVDTAQKRYADKGFHVIALSMDGKNIAKVSKFMAQHNIRNLQPLVDSEMLSFNALKIPGLPATVFVNARGEEIARVTGPLDWNDKNTTAFIEDQLDLTGQALK